VRALINPATSISNLFDLEGPNLFAPLCTLLRPIEKFQPSNF
jgi:hypothetical protein